MAPSQDYYQLLQVSPKADPAIIKAAYYTQLRVLKKHPDLGGTHEESTLLNEAYEILSDPSRRREYDKQFFKGLSSLASAPEPNPFVPERELRRATRVVFQNRFQLRVVKGASLGLLKGDWVSAQFCDISLTGACFRSLKPFKKGDAVELDISDNPAVKPTAKICWVRSIPQRFGLPIYEGGLEFKKIDSVTFRQYLRLVGLGNIL